METNTGFRLDDVARTTNIVAAAIVCLPVYVACPTPVARLAPYRSATIVAFALREGAAIAGLVLTLLTGELAGWLALSAGALAAMLMGWPRRSAMERRASDIVPIG